jgi:cytochrome c5
LILIKIAEGSMKTKKIGFNGYFLSLALLATCSSQVIAAERTGKQVVDAVCISCHATGKDGAPKIGDQSAWAQRASKGLDKLTANAITGVRNMPAHGGQASLSDLEMSRAVGYLVSGGNAADTNKVYSSSNLRSGDQVVQERCQECHVAGKNGAPKLGDMAGWKPRLVNGVQPLVKSAISGHNGMPARGGLNNLSDAEIKSAVEYMVSLTGGAQSKK